MLRQITGGGALTNKNITDLNANFAAVLGGLTLGNVIYCQPSSVGVSPVQDGSQQYPYQSLAAAYGAGRSGKNDIIVLVGNGAASGTARVNASFTWAKDALHLIGVASPVFYSQRARIAPSSGTTAFTPFFTISGNGCIFQNIQWFMGFTTGTTSQVGMVLTGSRNYFQNCAIDGMGDNESAQSAGSRSLVIGSGGSGENVFVDCSIGVDTITRTQANASVEFAGGTARNVFRNCVFPFMTSAAGVLGILGTGAACMDRHQIFDNCTFVNAIKSTSTTMTVLGSLTSASPGGLIIFKQCILLGIGEYGDANALANSYIDGFTGAAATSGIAVNPS
jgi:hypothetical protein